MTSTLSAPRRRAAVPLVKRALRGFIRGSLANLCIGWAEARHMRNGKADFEIRPHGELYLNRYRRLRSRLLCVYVHQTCADDDNRALHDHPWWNVSIVLRGSYFEIMPCRPKGYVGGDAVMAVRREAGDIVFRRPTAPHRLMLPADREPCWSLFITGPRVRDWGFYCPGFPGRAARWVHENIYRAKDDGGASVGAGCD